MLDVTLPNPPGTAVFIKMMLFNPEVDPGIKERNVAGMQGGGREINELPSETKKNQSWECYLETREGSPHPRG
jgi:hypothetical protein